MRRHVGGSPPLNVTNWPFCSASGVAGWNSLPGRSASLGCAAAALRQLMGGPASSWPRPVHTSTRKFTYFHRITQMDVFRPTALPPAKRHCFSPSFLMMVESPPGIFLLSLPAPLQWPSAAVIPLPLIFISTSACSLRCGHARYNTAWHQILSSVRGFVNKCRRPSIKKTGLSALAPSQLCVI